MLGYLDRVASRQLIHHLLPISDPGLNHTGCFGSILSEGLEGWHERAGEFAMVGLEKLDSGVTDCLKP